MKIRSAREIGHLIRDSRKRLGLTQAQLAARVGASRKWIIDLEAGRRTSDLRLVLRAANAVGLDVHATERTRDPAHEGFSIDDVLIEAARRAPG